MADPVDGLILLSPCTRSVGFEVGVGAGDAAEDADTLAIELEIGSDLEFEGSETGVDFFLNFFG